MFIILFYVMVTYGGYQLCTRAKQAVSTMPQFTMGQVYTIFPIAGVLCILSAVLNLVVELTTKPEGRRIQMIAWLLISFFVLLFLGVPIAMSLGPVRHGRHPVPWAAAAPSPLPSACLRGMNSFTLLAIPLYTFAGFTMSKGGISKRLMDFCYPSSATSTAVWLT